MKHTEVELKLRFDAEHGESKGIKDIKEFLIKGNYLSYQILAEQEKEMEASYYDTKDARLRQAGLTIRIRREGDDWMATVKDQGVSAGGLHERNEWNVPVKGKLPKLEIFEGTEIGQRLVQVCQGQKLQELFVTQFIRQSMILGSLEGKSKIELALDCGKIIVSRQSEPIQELELELIEGNPEDLLQLGAVLAREFPLWLETKSKFYRGLILAGYVNKANEKVQTVAIDVTDCISKTDLDDKLRMGEKSGLTEPEIQWLIKDLLLENLFALIKAQEYFLVDSLRLEKHRTLLHWVRKMMKDTVVSVAYLQHGEATDLIKVLSEAKCVWEQMEIELDSGLNRVELKGGYPIDELAAQWSPGKYTSFFLAFWRELIKKG